MGDQKPPANAVQFMIDDEVYDPEVRKSVVSAHATATSALGPYVMEYMMMLFFDENGEKIVKVHEFIDSAYGLDFFARLAALKGGETEGGQ